jgi:TonB family protein
MPTIIASLILSLFFFQSSDKEKKTDREYDNLNGPVRLVRVETEYPPDRTGNPKNNVRGLSKIILYDINGMESEEVLFNSSQETCALRRHVFSYDDKNNRTVTTFRGQSIVTSKPDDSQSPYSHSIIKQSFKLDDFGRRSEMQEYDSAGKFRAKQLYKYDDKGRVKEIASVYNDSVQLRCEFKYNDKGLPGEENCEGQETRGTGKTTYIYEYDGNGSWIKRTATHTDTLPNSKSQESQQITYREIKLYSSNQAEQKEIADALDSSKLVPCMLPKIIRKSGGVLQGSAIKRVSPSYPSGAKAAGVGGTVIVEVTVDETGKVISARAISGPVELRDASIEAARKWEFQPTMLIKIPVKVIGTISFHYNL